MRIRVALVLFAWICLCTSLSTAQDLSKAVIDYHHSEVYDHAIISASKIQQIELHQYLYADDSLASDHIIEKHTFNKEGYSAYTFTKHLGHEKREIHAQYDDKGHPIKKEIYGISPNLNYELTEWYDWQYTNGTLTKQSHYLLTDNIPVEKGAYGFPAKFFLLNNDSIAYNYLDSTCLIIRNNRDHCPFPKHELYPPNFQQTIFITLKFHPNNKLKSKIIKRGTTEQLETYDICGKDTRESQINEKCSHQLFDPSLCLSKEKIRICNEADTMTLNNELVYVINQQGSVFQHDSGPGTTISHNGQSYYNQNFDIIRSNITTTFTRGESFDNLPFGSASQSQTLFTEYAYYENGLQKHVVIKDEKGNLIQVLRWEVEYFE